MEGPISFWGYKEQESNLILLEHDDDEQFVLQILNRVIILSLPLTQFLFSNYCLH